MAAVGRIDEMVKEYLLFRGLTSTVRSMENEIKTDRDRGFRVDKIVEQFLSYINTHDLTQLREHWSYLDQHLFSRLEHSYAISVRRLEVSILKFYVIKAVESNRQDKISEFFEKLTPEIQGQSEWREWFALPYIKLPQTNSAFSLNFNPQWQDTVILSLHNFLSVIFQSMPVPALLRFEEDAKVIKRLEEENEMYRQQVNALLKTHALEGRQEGSVRSDRTSSGISGVEMMDDFYVIAQNTHDDGQTNQPTKTNLKTVLKELPKRLAPIGMNKKSAAQKQEANKQKQTDSVAKDVKKAKITQSNPTMVTSGVGELNLTSQSEVIASSFPSKLRTNNEHERMRRELLGVTDACRLQREKPEGSSPTSTSSSAIQSQVPPYARSQSSKGSSSALSDGDLQMESKTEENGRFGKRPSPNRPSRVTSESALSMQTPNENQSSPRRQSSPLTIASTDPLRGSLTEDGEDSPFLLIGQEEFVEHHSTITHCRFSQTGAHIASSDVDGVVKIWALQPSPTTVATIMSKSAFTSLEWASRQDRMILLGNKAGCIKLFDVKEKRTIYEASSDPVYPRIVSLNSSPQGLSFVCSAVGKVQQIVAGQLTVWDIKTMQVERKLPLNTPGVAVNCSSFNHNGHLLVTGGTDGCIRMFDIQRHECIACWQAHTGEVISVQFSFDENSLYSMGIDNKFHQWSVHRTGNKLADMKIHTGVAGPFTVSGYGGYKQVYTPKGKLFAFDSEGNYILTCSQHGGVIYKTNVGSLQRTMVLRGHKTPVVSVDWSPSVDTKICLTGGMDGKVLVSTLLSQSS